jgi:hypothetical protein
LVGFRPRNDFPDTAAHEVNATRGAWLRFRDSRAQTVGSIGMSVRSCSPPARG